MQKLYEPKEISEITGIDKQEMRELLHDYEDIVNACLEQDDTRVRSHPCHL